MDGAGSMVRSIRRIVTGHDAQGQSVVLMDAPSPHVMYLLGVPNFGVTDLWKTHASPASNTGSEDSCALPITLAPSRQGTVFRIVEFPPDQDYIGSWKRDEAFAGLGESGRDALHADAGRHEMMHRTNSVDYAFVLSGEIWAVLDRDEVLMKTGDTLIQRGTNHAWSNRTNRPCLMGFVLIGAEPPGGQR